MQVLPIQPVGIAICVPVPFSVTNGARTGCDSRRSACRNSAGNRADAEPVPMDVLLKRARSKQVVILDTRPASEYIAGHIPGALSIPVDDLQRRLKQLPRGKEYVAYCRGPYCIYADRAVEILRARGRRARRLVEGFPEWRSAGFPVSQGTGPGALR